MPPIRRRQFVGRTVLVLAFVALLVSGYVGSWIGMFWLKGRGTVSAPTTMKLETTVFAPIDVYCRMHLPGHDFLVDAAFWSEMRAQGYSITWQQFRSRRQ